MGTVLMLDSAHKDDLDGDGGDGYSRLVGSLVYHSGTVRPDLAYPAAYLGQYLARLGHAHWAAAKRVLRYLKGTAVYWQRLGGFKSGGKNCVYSDSDWAGDPVQRRYTTYCSAQRSSHVPSSRRAANRCSLRSQRRRLR